jgi:hypothetical protein
MPTAPKTQASSQKALLDMIPRHVLLGIASHKILKGVQTYNRLPIVVPRLPVYLNNCCTPIVIIRIVHSP